MISQVYIDWTTEVQNTLNYWGPIKTEIQNRTHRKTVLEDDQ